jgi:hypothetical protein
MNFLGSFACGEGTWVQSLGMSEGNLNPIPVRFSAELKARVEAISKSLALSHSGVLRLAVNQWFEAGGDKSGIFAPAKKAAKKAATKKSQ